MNIFPVYEKGRNFVGHLARHNGFMGNIFKGLTFRKGGKED